MRGALIATLCWTARLAAAVLVFTFDPETPYPPEESKESRTLSPVEARLVLAQRTGVEDYHVADLLSGGAIEAINSFGIQTPLFGREKRVHVSILVNIADTTHTDNHARFSVQPIPSANSTRHLYFDLARQHSPSEYLHQSDVDIASRLSSQKVPLDRDGNEKDDAFHVINFNSVQEWNAYWQDLMYLARTREADSKQQFAYAMTALVVSTSSQETSAGGRELWGYYSLPSRPGAQGLHRRQVEEPFEAPTSTPDRPNAFDMPITILQEPLPGILPACFASENACNSQTRNCTGHGSCRLAYTNRDTKDPEGKACYKCSCNATVTEVESGGKKTIYWGGSACQKRDVSSAFWLLAGMTVAMIGLVGFAVGSLFDCGQATLPSVIGAGVSGPGARGRQG